MTRAILAACVALCAFPAFAQDGGTLTDVEALRREFETKLDAARKETREVRDEMRAQAATQSVSQGWQEDWVSDKRKLERLTLDGYFRSRPELFYKMDLGRPADPAGYKLWPASSTSSADRTNAGVNMRLRLEPTINISEEVRVRAQIDALDNVVWGSTPDYAYSRNQANGYWYDTNAWSLFSNSQVAPRSGINSISDSVLVKRVWGEVSTPVGILRFGRMGSHFGLGILHNDGAGIDADTGDTVDRISFTAEPIPGFYITPMLDFNVEGILSPTTQTSNQSFDLSNSDDAHSFIISAARMDTASEAKAKLESNQTVLNYGLRFDYRVQKNDAIQLSSAWTSDGQASGAAPTTWTTVQRNANLFMPDLWAKFERRNFRIEAEAAAVMGWMDNGVTSIGDAYTSGTKNLIFWQFGGVLQGEYRLLNGDLEIGGEMGFASGDDKPGFGNYPRRENLNLTDKNGTPTPFTGLPPAGVIDGPQYCLGTGCAPRSNIVRNFRFNSAYRMDMILYRELLGNVTDSFYLRPKISYRITQGFNVFAAAIYSRAIYPSSTPSAATSSPDANLGIEVNVGARYETRDGFFAMIQYGALFPLGGFAATSTTDSTTLVNLDIAQVLRGVVGIRF
jgi:uncharacterized protein (TIGR04551 family)